MDVWMVAYWDDGRVDSKVESKDKQKVVQKETPKAVVSVVH
jgi:hypothetical protein